MANNEELIVKFKAVDEGLMEQVRKVKEALGETSTATEKAGTKTKEVLDTTKKSTKEMGANWTELFNTVRSGNFSFQGLLDTFGRFAGVATGVTAGFAATAYAIKAVLDHTAAAAKAVGELNEKAQNLGITVKQLATIQFAGIGAGGNAENITQSLSFFAERVGSAARGDQNAQKSFREIGVDITDTTGKLRNLNDLFLETISRFKDGAQGVREFSLASDFFGRSGKNMLENLRGMSDQVVRAQAAVRGLGGSLGQDSVDEIERYTKAIAALDKQSELAGASAHALALRNEYFIKTLKARMMGQDTSFADSIANPEKFKKYQELFSKGADSWFDRPGGAQPDFTKGRPFGSEVPKEIGNIEDALEELRLKTSEYNSVLKDTKKLTEEIYSPEPYGFGGGAKLTEAELIADLDAQIAKNRAIREGIKLGPEFTVTPNFDINGKDMKEANREWERYSEQVLKAMEAEAEFNREHEIWLRKYKESEDAFAGFNAGLQQFQDNIGRAGDQMRTFALNLSYGMANAFSSFFFDVMDRKIKNLKDAFVSLGRTIANVIQQAAAAAAGTALASLFLSGAGFAAGNSAGSAPINQGPGYPQFPSMGPPASGVQSTAAPVIIQLNAIDAQSGATFLMKNAGAIAAAIGKYNKKTPGGDVAMMG